MNQPVITRGESDATQKKLEKLESRARDSEPRRIPELPRMFALDRDYWLCRCEGFQLHGYNGRLGVVAEVRYRSRHDLPDELVVYGGLFGNRVTLVRVEDVFEILPGEMRMAASIACPERTPRLTGLRRMVGALRGEHKAVSVSGSTARS